MISIKKYLDQREVAPPPPAAPPCTQAELLAIARESYVKLLLGVGDHANRACAATGATLQEGLKRVEREVQEAATAPLSGPAEQAEAALSSWSEATVQHLKHRAEEVRELLLVLAKAGEDAYQRDQRYTKQFNNITQQLSSITKLDDISQVRTMVMRSAAMLKSSTAKMAEEGETSVRQLRAQICTYQNKLEEAERAATHDSLTGLHNRSSVEAQIQRRFDEKRTFSVMMLDLNGFKKVNDTYGHAAGDDLLKQFAQELGSLSRSGDVIGRWGGDEFVILVDANLEAAVQRVQRVREWACGEYTLKHPGGTAKLLMEASIGVAEAKPGEKMADLLRRADEAMYCEKKAAKSAGSKKN